MKGGSGLVVLCALFGYGLAIMCYECNSSTNSLCWDAKLPDSLKRNCTELNHGVTHTMCRKIIQHVDYGVKGEVPSSRVIRTCGWDETKYKGVCYHRSGYGGKQEVCSCTKDFCNGAQETQAAVALLISTILLSMFK